MVNLRTLAERDLAFTLTDALTGFGASVIITNPSGQSLTVDGQTGNIDAFDMDDNEQLTVGNRPHVALRTSDIVSLGEPRRIRNPSEKPWVIEFRDLQNNLWTTTVWRSKIDRTLGITLIFLTKYER